MGTDSFESEECVQSAGARTNGTNLFKWFENTRLARLSRRLRTKVADVRSLDPDAYVFRSSDLASLLGKNRHHIDSVLEFMRGKKWAGKNGDQDTWWVL
jgi:hypothetical protein